MTTETLPTTSGTVQAALYPLPVCVSGTASIQGTTNTPLAPIMDWGCIIFEHTNSGISIEENAAQSSSSAIMELHRISGLTWEQLAGLFGVTRRSLHFWASGKPLNAENEDHLRQILATIRRIDRGTSRENRSILLNELPEGGRPFDMLLEKKYGEVIDKIGSGSRQSRCKVRTSTRHTTALNKPRPPHELVDALQDAVHVKKGRIISSTPVRIKGRK